MTMMCQCRFTEYEKYTTLLQDLRSVGSYVCRCGSGREYMGTLNFSPQFSCKPSTALKNRLLIKKAYKQRHNDTYFSPTGILKSK